MEKTNVDGLCVAHLSVPVDDVFVGGQFGKCHRTACMKFLCGNAYFCAETELSAVGE